MNRWMVWHNDVAVILLAGKEPNFITLLTHKMYVTLLCHLKLWACLDIKSDLRTTKGFNTKNNQMRQHCTKYLL